MAVYLDVYFLLNCLADAMILKAVQTSMGRAQGRRRIWLGAAAGGAGACGLLLCHGRRGWEMGGGLALALLLCRISFGKQTGKQRLREVLLFYGYGMLLGGVLSALSMRWPAGARTGGFLPAAVWLAAVLGCYGLVQLFVKLYGAYRFRARRLNVTIVWGDRRWALTGMVDTGNTLRDPQSGSPVMVVQQSALAGEGAESLFRTCGDAAAGIRLIPFQTVGRASGVLLGFRPDLAEIGSRRVEAVVALTDRVLDAGNDYQVLLHPELAGEI